jgi:hypothetical protein
VAQSPPLTRPDTAAALVLALAAIGLSYAQRRLSTPARALRRRATTVHGVITLSDGTHETVDRSTLLAPLETVLKTLSITMPLLAVALILPHTHW